MPKTNSFLMVCAFVFLAAFIALAGRDGPVHVADAVAQTDN